MENSDPYRTLKIYWLTGLTIAYSPMNTSLSPVSNITKADEKVYKFKSCKEI